MCRWWKCLWFWEDYGTVLCGWILSCWTLHVKANWYILFYLKWFKAYDPVFIIVLMSVKSPPFINELLCYLHSVFCRLSHTCFCVNKIFFVNNTFLKCLCKRLKYVSLKRNLWQFWQLERGICVYISIKWAL